MVTRIEGNVLDLNSILVIAVDMGIFAALLNRLLKHRTLECHEKSKLVDLTKYLRSRIRIFSRIAETRIHLQTN